MPRSSALNEAMTERIWELRAQGLSDHEVGRRLGLGTNTVSLYLRGLGGIRPRPRRRADRCLSASEREEISRGIASGRSARAIARALGRSHTTIAREINRAGGRGRYRAQAPTARPGGGPAGRARESSSSAASFAEWSKSTCARTTPPSRSPAGSVLPTPTMRRCRSPTRRSTAPSTSRGEER